MADARAQYALMTVEHVVEVLEGNPCGTSVTM
jgi:hypothetical protein